MDTICLICTNWGFECFCENGRWPMIRFGLSDLEMKLISKSFPCPFDFISCKYIVHYAGYCSSDTQSQPYSDQTPVQDEYKDINQWDYEDDFS